MQTLQKEYMDRLRPRKCNYKLLSYMANTHKISDLKLAKAWTNKSQKLEKEIQDLNTDKAKDPSGLCAELFILNVMGPNLKLNLLTMLNNIKEGGIISDIMK